MKMMMVKVKAVGEEDTRKMILCVEERV